MSLILVQPQDSRVKRQFYRRDLPDICVAFSSDQGKEIFKQALAKGDANIYFRLAEQYHTQSEPSFCGLSTLVMVLNALQVDPKRIWQLGWRWYSEEMLNSCLPMEVIRAKGITMDEYICLAACNNLDLKVVRMAEKDTLEDFRKTVKSICKSDDVVLTCHYSRKLLNQTGDGHFSPIGAYNESEDMVLIFDVARYKYPPHWVKLDLLWEAMKIEDNETGLPRGYVVMRKLEENPLLLFRLSVTFRVTVSKCQATRMSEFLKSWNSFLATQITGDICSHVCSNLSETVKYVLNALNEALSFLLVDESIFTTQFNMCCTSKLTTEHRENVGLLISALENTEVFQLVSKWLQTYTTELSRKDLCKNGRKICKKINCCRLNQIGRSIADIEDVLLKKREDGTVHQISKCDKNQKNMLSMCDHKQEKNTITDCHYITLLLLAWPYSPEGEKTYSFCLSRSASKSLINCDYILRNEIAQLQQQIQCTINSALA